MGYWRTKAKRIIQTALADAKVNGIRGRALRREVNRRFEEYGHPRSKYPYRVWLQELDAAMFKELNGCSQMSLGLEDIPAP